MKNIFLVCLVTLSCASSSLLHAEDTPATTPSDASTKTMPSPIDSPPFPFADWIGPNLGEADSTPDYPLQKLLFKDKLDKSRVKVYGWINAGVNASTSKNSNTPMSYDLVPNMIELDQAILRIERQPDTSQNEHTDWGFRFTNLGGIDYRYTAAKGWLGQQLLHHNNLYGYDPVELYGMIYFPHIAEGVLLKIGRFISPPDIEAQLAPDNYMYSHSVMFTFDPYTFTGLLATTKLHKQWNLDIGVDAGSDMAPWTNSAQPNAHLMVRWVSKDNDDSLWGGVNAIGSGKYKNGHDNLQQVVGIWGHRFNSRIHMMSEAYYMWQFDAAQGGSCNYGPVHKFGGGGGCGPIIPGRSDEIGVVNNIEIKLSSRDYISIRNDVFDDKQGQRSGYATIYSSHTVGWSYRFNDFVTTRPELRYERAWTNNATPYDNGTRKDQYTFAMDLTLRF